MEISELGSLGELFSSIAMLITLVFLFVEKRHSNLIQQRQNAAQTATNNGTSLLAILAEDVSEIFMRGNNEGLGCLTQHERYRYDISYFTWLQTIEVAYADFHAGIYPEQSLVSWEMYLTDLLLSLLLCHLIARL